MEQQIEQLFPVADVAQRLRIAERTVWNLVADGRLSVVRPPGLRIARIPESSIIALMKGQDSTTS